MSDKSLLIKRTPHAFAFFLATMKSRVRGYKKVRLHAKTTVWRMDLMSLRYRALHDSAKQLFIAMSEEALAHKSRVRLQKLHTLPGADVGPSQASADPHAAVAPALSSAVAEGPIDAAPVAKDAQTVAGEVAMPGQSPGYATWHHDAREAVTPSAPASYWPLNWQCTDKHSTVHRDLVARMPQLGSGAFGCCFAVEDALTGESFCLKVARPGDQNAEICLKSEFDVLGHLKHTNIMRTEGWAIARDGSYEGFLMSLADCNLWEWIEGCAHLTRDRGVSALVQIARGLSFVHCKGIVHLDLKPENIVARQIVTRHSSQGCMNFQIADFGQCQLAAKGQEPPAGKILADLVNATLYRPLHLFHAAGSEVSVCYTFDVWAFGCIVFDVMQGHPRSRSANGKAVRLFSGVCMEDEYDYVLRVRNYRLVQMVEKEVATLVTRCQPDHRLKAASDRYMCADLVRAVMGLAA